MSGPWERYQAQPAENSAPWGRYQAPDEGPTPSWGRTARLAARDVLGGLAGVPDMLVNGAAAIGNAPAVAWDAVRGNAPGTSEPFRYNVLTRAADAYGDMAGAPRAETDGERLTSSMVRGASGSLPFIAAGAVPALVRGAPQLAAALRSAPIGQVVGGATGGAAGYAAEEAGAGPAGTMAASLLGGVAGAGAVAAGAAAGRGAQAMGTPFFQGGRDRIVGNTMMRFSSDPATLADRLTARVGAEPAVPGSIPTTAEAVRDTGLSGLQRTLQNGDPQMANTLALRGEARDVARVGALDTVAPDTGGAPVVTAAMEREAARLRLAERLGNDGAAADLAAAQGRLPAPMTAEEAGGAIRAPLSDAYGDFRAGTSAAFNAVDPAGTARIPIIGIQQRAAALAAERFTPLSGGPSADLAGLFSRLAGAPPETSWRDVQGLRSTLSQISGDMTQAPSASVAKQLLGELDTALDTAALPRELPTTPRTMADIQAQGSAEGMAQFPNIDQQLNGATGTARAAAASQEKSLIQALTEAGGIYDPGGDMRQITESGTIRPGLFRRERTRRSMTGQRQPGEAMNMDEAATFARSRGYFPEFDADYGGGGVDGFRNADLINAMDDELRGGGARYAGEAPLRAAIDDADGNARELRQRLSERGGSGFERGEEAAGILRDQTEGAPAPMDRPEPVMFPTNPFTPDMATAYREAIARRREQGRLFEDGQAGNVLRERYGRSVVPDSGVAGRFFRPGPGAPESLRVLNKAAPGTTDAVQRYAAESLRAAAVDRDGSINPQALARWRARHADALRELPALDDVTSSVQKAADALARVSDEGAARTAEFTGGAARFFLDRDPGRAMSGLLSQPDAAGQVRALAAIVGRDPAARDGLRRAFVDELQRAARTQTDHAGGARRLSSAGAGRFWERTQEAAAGLFTPAEVGRLRAVVNDLRGQEFPNNSGRAVGSNTVQNLASANILSRMTNGGFDGAGGGIGSQAFRLARRLYTAPEALIQQQLQGAAMDPVAALRAVQAAQNPGPLTRFITGGSDANIQLAERLASHGTDGGIDAGRIMAGMLARRLTSLQGAEQEPPRRQSR